MDVPEITNDELDEIEASRRKASAALTALTWPVWDYHGKEVAVALAHMLRLIKALRACRVLEAARAKVTPTIIGMLNANGDIMTTEAMLAVLRREGWKQPAAPEVSDE